MMMMLTMQTSWCGTWCCCCWPARPDDDDVEDIAFWPAGPNCSGQRLLERPGRHWGRHNVHPQVHLVSCHTVVEIKQTCLHWKSSDINSRWETFKSIQVWISNLSSNYWQLLSQRASGKKEWCWWWWCVDEDDHAHDVDDNVDKIMSIILMMMLTTVLAIMLIRSCRSNWWWCFF